MKETVQELRHVSQFHMDDFDHAYSPDLAVGVLNDQDGRGSLYAPGQGWSDPLDIPDRHRNHTEDFDREERQS